MNLRRVEAAARQTAATAIRRGRTTVLLTQNPGPRFGNFLYFWLRATTRYQPRHPYRVQVHSHLKPWLDALPLVQQELSIWSRDIHIRYPREWPEAHYYQRHGMDFTSDDIAQFAERYLFPSPLFQSLPEDRHGSVTVNVRRGDYYSNPTFRALYGFDVEAYIARALSLAQSRQTISAIRVVSDDLHWCRQHLDSVLKRYTSEVTFGPGGSGPLEDFRAMAAARRLIGTNSTFSFWGGYLVSAMHAQDAEVIFPRFYSRHELAGPEIDRHLPNFLAIGDSTEGSHSPV